MQFLQTYLLLFIVLFCACNSENNVSKNEVITQKLESLNDFILQTKTATPAKVIPQDFCQKFIKPALEQHLFYPFTKDIVCNYGQVIYEHPNFVAISFYYNNNSSSASFVAIYQLSSEHFLDSKQLFGSSVFVNEEHPKGLGISYQTTIVYPKDSTIILRLVSTEKCISNYNKNTNEQTTTINHYQYNLTENGLFEL